MSDVVWSVSARERSAIILTTKISKLLLILFLMVPVIYAAQPGVRTIFVKGKESALVRTSPGFSTIVEVPDPIRYFIAGNQEAFKVEFVENRLAIKPLVYSGETNLYVATSNGFFYLTLEIVPPQRVDYIVRIEFTPSKKKIGKEIRDGEALLAIDELSKSERLFHIDFSIKNIGKTKLHIIPEKMRLYGKTQIPVLKIFIPKDEVPSQSVLRGRADFVKGYLGHVATLRLHIPFDNGREIAISFQADFFQE